MKFWIFAIYSLIAGTIVGAFLNVCIYRVPRGIALWHPSRSFCPACRASLQGHEMIPILSWILLKGRCSRCHASISLRYPLVELLTGMLFLVFWIVAGYPQVLGYWILGALLIAATFIDLETLTIPNSLTVGGVVAGLVLSLLFPASLGSESAGAGLFKALTGAGTGYLLLWGVLEVGKWCFGRIRLRWDSPQEFCLTRKEGKLRFQCAGEIWHEDEMFVRKSDELIVETDFWKMPENFEGKGFIRFKNGYLFSSQGEKMLGEGQKISGAATAAVIPREAMGWGDVKLLAAIGAFVGVPGVLFTIFFASLFGALVGACILFPRCHQGIPIPFGPFLATGALAWILGGKTFWNIYFAHLGI